MSAEEEALRAKVVALEAQLAAQRTEDVLCDWFGLFLTLQGRFRDTVGVTQHDADLLGQFKAKRNARVHPVVPLQAARDLTRAAPVDVLGSEQTRTAMLRVLAALESVVNAEGFRLSQSGGAGGRAPLGAAPRAAYRSWQAKGPGPRSAYAGPGAVGAWRFQAPATSTPARGLWRQPDHQPSPPAAALPGAPPGTI
jgi:hypothetical protein